MTGPRFKPRISLKPPAQPPERRAPKVDIVGVSKLVSLQRKLNSRFMMMRDKGQNTDGIYGQLKLVERRLNRLNVYW